MPLFEQYVTLQCVSNEVGGDLVGNAKWTGVSCATCSTRPGCRPGATQLVGRSVDGFTAGFPPRTDGHVPRPDDRAGDERRPAARHPRFPARLVIPGLYGYVSATKWLAEIQMTTLEAFDGYWVPLGWAKQGRS